MNSEWLEFVSGFPILLTVGLIIFLLINRKTYSFYISASVLAGTGILCYAIIILVLKYTEHNEGAGPAFGAVFSMFISLIAAILMVIVGVVFHVIRNKRQ